MNVPPSKEKKRKKTKKQKTKPKEKGYKIMGSIP
jgi:hypothetical protein